MANGHDWQTIADLIGKQYLGKTTLICEPTMRNNRHQLLFAVANSKLWRVSEDIVKTVAPTVEWARHNHHGTAWGKTLKKVTHPDTVVYDDLCYEEMVKENIQLNGIAICPLSGVRGGPFAFFTKCLVGVAEVNEIRRHKFVANGLNTLEQFKGMPQLPHLGTEEATRNRQEGSRRAGAKRARLRHMLTEEERAELRPRRKFVVDMEAEAKSKAVTIKDVLDRKGKYYDPCGRTRKFIANQWNNCCTFSDCRAGYQWCKRPGGRVVNGPSLTGFNKCNRHSDATRAPAIQQTLGKYF